MTGLQEGGNQPPAIVRAMRHTHEHDDGDGDALRRMAEHQRARLPLAREWWSLGGGRVGARVADVGCGPGVLTLQYAAWAGPTGRVLALDVETDALAALRARMDPLAHANVEARAFDAESERLKETLDLVLVTDVLHHFERPEDALANLRGPHRALVLADYDPEGEGELGPPRDDRIGAEEAADMLRAAGWAVQPPRAQAMEHYVLIARDPS